MMASRLLDSRVATGYWSLGVYAWVPSQEDLHRLWRADKLQAGPKQKKDRRVGRGRRPQSIFESGHKDDEPRRYHSQPHFAIRIHRQNSE